MTTLTTPHVLKQKEIEKALCGEKILLNQLLQSMRKRVLAVLQKNGVSLNDTEDCVQHALIKFWEHKNDIHPENNVIFSWLCTTALNKARDIQRKGFRTDFVGDDDVFDTLLSPIEMVLPDNQQIGHLQSALSQLKESHRTILTMQLAGKSYSDIATYLNCPPGTVMSRRSRAIDELRKIYQEMSPESFEKD